MSNYYERRIKLWEQFLKWKIKRIIYLIEYISGQRIPSFSNITYHSRKLSPIKDWEKLRPEKYLGEDYWAGRIGLEENIEHHDDDIKTLTRYDSNI